MSVWWERSYMKSQSFPYQRWNKRTISVRVTGEKKICKGSNSVFGNVVPTLTDNITISQGDRSVKYISHDTSTNDQHLDNWISIIFHPVLSGQRSHDYLQKYWTSTPMKNQAYCCGHTFKKQFRCSIIKSLRFPIHIVAKERCCVVLKSSRKHFIGQFHQAIYRGTRRLGPCKERVFPKLRDPQRGSVLGVVQYHWLQWLTRQGGPTTHHRNQFRKWWVTSHKNPCNDHLFYGSVLDVVVLCRRWRG